MAEEQESRLSPESKVGILVLAGLIVLIVSILMLGEIHFKPQEKYYIRFNNVEGITENSPVKISGVQVGEVSEVKLKGEKGVILFRVARNIPLYRNASARIRSTGIIGTKYIALMPGSPVPGIAPESQLLNSGDTINGVEALSLDDLLEQAANSLESITHGGKLGDNLNATMANLRSITDSLNSALGQQRKSLVNIVKNMEGFSSYAKSASAHLDEILSNSKNDIEVVVHTLRDTLERMNTIIAGVQQGQGAIGALVSNRQAGEDMKQTLENLKATSESAKQVMARFTKVRAFWQVGGRYDFKAQVSRGDVGIELDPRPEKFYLIEGQNLGTKTSFQDKPLDYERQNTVMALLGEHWGPFTGAVGFIQSRGGVEVRYRPFQDRDVPVLNRLELVGQGFDFGRNDVIKGKQFNLPNYTAGARVRINQYVTAGVQAEDVAETTDYTGTLNLSFEDRDIAYLIGFVTFAR
jgi:phospholipid/cholesterol/gamma-HCH transport system substrate-binding protein